MKYRIVFRPWLNLTPFVLEKRSTPYDEWECCSQSFRDLDAVDRFIANMKEGERTVREFET